MNRDIVVGVAIIVVLSITAYFFLERGSVEKEVLPLEAVTDESSQKTYSNDTYGVRFEYPATYYLETKEESEPGRTHISIILTEDTDENRMLREGTTTIPREGPISITFDVYQDTIASPTLVEWLKETPASNFDLSDGTFENTTFGGEPAVRYRWDGLYQADTIAVAHGDYILSGTVTFIAPTDSIRSVFESIIKTVTFY